VHLRWPCYYPAACSPQLSLIFRVAASMTWHLSWCVMGEQFAAVAGLDGLALNSPLSRPICALLDSARAVLAWPEKRLEPTLCALIAVCWLFCPTSPESSL